MKRAIGIVAVVAYVGVVVAANYAFNRWGFVSVGFGLMAPAAVYFVGVAFTARDIVQETLGRWVVIGAIIIGAILSWGVADGRVALASGAAFLVSETIDFLIYTPLRSKDWLGAVVASNVVGAAIDSVVFLWIAVGSLAFFWGQMVGKMWMTVAAIVVLALLRRSYYREVVNA